MDLTNNKRLFSLTPVVEDNPPNRQSKYPIVPVFDVGTLGEYFNVPANISTGFSYDHRLMFQFNYSFYTNFYLTNVPMMGSFGGLLLSAGCVCIKYRIGNTVFRYKLIDSEGTTANWSGFIKYTNQLIKKNFCLEFWQKGATNYSGINQPFVLKTSTIVIPTDTDQDNTYFDIPLPPLSVDDMSTPFPAVLPINNSNQAFLDNV